MGEGLPAWLRRFSNCRHLILPASFCVVNALVVVLSVVFWEWLNDGELSLSKRIEPEKAEIYRTFEPAGFPKALSH